MLLDEFTHSLGTGSGIPIDEERLRNWTTGVRRLAGEADRLGIADLKIGQLLAVREGFGEPTWPPLAICRLLEEMGSTDMLDGFNNGLFNRRGITSRGLDDGGQPERELAEKYREAAKQRQAEFPRVARALNDLAEDYDRSAEHEDQIAERRRFGR